MRSVKNQSNYHPANDNTYMSANMINFFTEKLHEMRHQFLQKEHETEDAMHELKSDNIEMIDAAQEQIRLETEIIPTLEFERSLLLDIDKALERIQSGEYGYCEKTGEEIGIERLQAVPTANKCQAAQAEEERNLHIRN